MVLEKLSPSAYRILNTNIQLHAPVFQNERPMKQNILTPAMDTLSQDVCTTNVTYLRLFVQIKQPIDKIPTQLVTVKNDELPTAVRIAK